MDYLIELAQLVNSRVSTESVLYKFDDHYGLFVEDVNGIVEESRGHFVEYGEISQLTREYLEEHGQLLIREQALKILSEL